MNAPTPLIQKMLHFLAPSLLPLAEGSWDCSIVDERAPAAADEKPASFPSEARPTPAAAGSRALYTVLLRAQHQEEAFLVPVLSDGAGELMSIGKPIPRRDIKADPERATNADHVVVFFSQSQAGTWVVLALSYRSPAMHRGPFYRYELYRLENGAARLAAEFVSEDEFEGDRGFTRSYVFARNGAGDLEVQEWRRSRPDGGAETEEEILWKWDGREFASQKLP